MEWVSEMCSGGGARLGDLNSGTWTRDSELCLVQKRGHNSLPNPHRIQHDLVRDFGYEDEFRARNMERFFLNAATNCLNALS